LPRFEKIKGKIEILSTRNFIHR